VSDHQFSVTPSSTAEIIRPMQFAGSEAAPLGIGHNQSDPLACWTPRQVFFACIWLADISTSLKLFLLCVGRFFDEEARSSSMSYAQVARECGMHESSAKRTAKAVAGVWLKVEIGKGRQTARGPQNLYHGQCPPAVVDELRNQVRETSEGVSVCDPNGNGVSIDDPKGSHHATTNAFKGSPYAQMGSPSETRTTHTLKKESVVGKGSHTETHSHFNGAGFVISPEPGHTVPHDKLEEWRARFPHLPSLEAKLEDLAAKILKKGIMHPGWSSPGAWMVNILATDNKRAEQEARVAEEKLRRAKGSSATKVSDPSRIRRI
jgi:hypothetical protein